MLLEGGYVILPYWCCGFLPFVIKKHIKNCTYNKFLANAFMIFTSEVTTFHHRLKSFFSSISRSQFWMINKNIFCCAQTANASHTQFIGSGDGMVSPPRFKIIRYSWSGWSLYLLRIYGTVICILRQELFLIFFKYFSAVQPAISKATSESMSVSIEIPGKSISVFSFIIYFSPGQLILISSSIPISPFNKHLIFKNF